MKIYNKLVRDNIPEIIRQDGFQCETEVLERSEYMDKLNQKLKEELEEYFTVNNDTRFNFYLEELVDLVEVIYAILDFKGISIEEFEKIRISKKEEKGGFKKRLLLARAGKSVEANG